MTSGLTIAMADLAVGVAGDPRLLDYVESRYATAPAAATPTDASIELILGAGTRPEHDHEGTWIEIEDSAVHIDQTSARLFVQPANYHYVLSCVLPIALAHLAASRGWVALHAAAVAGERAVLLVGPTGTGKSSLSVLATRYGYDVLGDDQVLVRLRDGAAEVAGVGRRVAAPVSFVRSCGHDGELMAKDPRQRVMIDSLRLANGWRPLAGSVLLDGQADEGPRIGGVRYFGHLLESTWVADHRAQLASLTKILRAVAETPATTITPVVGHPTDEAWDRIVAMMEGT